MKDRFIPVVDNRRLRLFLGLVLASTSPLVAARILDIGRPSVLLILSFVIFSWLPAVYLTDKYRHKYPQRYYTYLLASHAKAAVVMLIGALATRLVAGPIGAPLGLLVLSVSLVVLADAGISAARRRVPPKPTLPLQAAKSMATGNANGNGNGAYPESKHVDVNAAELLSRLDSQVPASTVEFLRTQMPGTNGENGELLVVDDIPADERDRVLRQAGLLIGRTSLNRVSRLNLFLKYCTSQVAMGGYVAFNYTPLDEVYAKLRQRFPGLLYWPAFAAHFAWYRAIPKIPWLDKVYFSRQLSWVDRLISRGGVTRNRVLSKAEVWGRLAFYGMEVVAEKPVGSERLILARRVSEPVANRKPSYYAVVALEKVGLDGERIRLHKVRSMYPFSEFLQKAIFEKHGLSTTGKFNNDFRITEYGRLFRRHWIDELPGLFDWLRGDIKLVGMRATSPHFLSLYPVEFYDLYTQVKPGLIPPIFDESTGGFEKIVEVEQTYLKRYTQAPTRTDVLYFWYTFRDIFVRRVRSH